MKSHFQSSATTSTSSGWVVADLPAVDAAARACSRKMDQVRQQVLAELGVPQ